MIENRVRTFAKLFLNQGSTNHRTKNIHNKKHFNYDTESVIVVAIFYQISYKKIYMKNSHVPNGARM